MANYRESAVILTTLVDLSGQLSNLREAILRLTEELDRRRYRTAERP